jgi:hypothetical protein
MTLPKVRQVPVLILNLLLLIIVGFLSNYAAINRDTGEGHSMDFPVKVSFPVAVSM